MKQASTQHGEHGTEVSIHLSAEQLTAITALVQIGAADSVDAFVQGLVNSALGAGRPAMETGSHWFAYFVHDPAPLYDRTHLTKWHTSFGRDPAIPVYVDVERSGVPFGVRLGCCELAPGAGGIRIGAARLVNDLHVSLGGVGAAGHHDRLTSHAEPVVEAEALEPEADGDRRAARLDAMVDAILVEDADLLDRLSK